MHTEKMTSRPLRSGAFENWTVASGSQNVSSHLRVSSVSAVAKNCELKVSTLSQRTRRSRTHVFEPGQSLCLQCVGRRHGCLSKVWFCRCSDGVNSLRRRYTAEYPSGCHSEVTRETPLQSAFPAPKRTARLVGPLLAHIAEHFRVLRCPVSTLLSVEYRRNRLLVEFWKVIL